METLLSCGLIVSTKEKDRYSFTVERRSGASGAIRRHIAFIQVGKSPTETIVYFEAVIYANELVGISDWLKKFFCDGNRVLPR